MDGPKLSDLVRVGAAPYRGQKGQNDGQRDCGPEKGNGLIDRANGQGKRAGTDAEKNQRCRKQNGDQAEHASGYLPCYGEILAKKS